MEKASCYWSGLYSACDFPPPPPQFTSGGRLQPPFVTKAAGFTTAGGARLQHSAVIGIWSQGQIPPADWAEWDGGTQSGSGTFVLTPTGNV